MRYQVPQFIEVEDKIFGPLTVKQFLYLGGGAGLTFIVIKILPLFIGIPLAVPVAGFFLALAFYKPNNKPFIDMVESAFNYAVGSKLYIWKKNETKTRTENKPVEEKDADANNLFVPKLSDSKLRELTWSLDVKQNKYTNSDKMIQ
jgi:hypothetical protein